MSKKFTIKIKQNILTPKGKPIKEVVRESVGGEIKEELKDIILQDILLQALAVGYEPRAQLSAKEFAINHKLSRKIGADVEEVELKSQDVALLKQLVERLPQNVGMAVSVAAEVLNMIEPFEDEKEEAAE